MSYQRIRRLLLLSIGLWLATALVATNAFGQVKVPKVFPDYRNPPRAYQDVTIEGRTYIVEKQLLDEDPTGARKALLRLQKNIDMALEILPLHAHPFVAKQQFWLLYGPKSTGGGVDNGLAYFRPGSPKFNVKRDERWNSVVVVYHAQNYVKLADLWALKSVLHELAHAYQLEQWPEKQPDILSAYDTAMAQKLYRNVRNNKGESFEVAYATTNQLEYFAELSCMFFAQCNYQPFNRSELIRYDPGGYDMIRKMWKIGDEHGKHASRTWRLGRTGKEIKGTFKSFERGRVTLTDDKGRNRTVSLTALHPIDQDHVKRWVGQ